MMRRTVLAQSIPREASTVAGPWPGRGRGRHRARRHRRSSTHGGALSPLPGESHPPSRRCRSVRAGSCVASVPIAMMENCLYLTHGNYGQNPAENQKAGEKQPEATEKSADLDDGGLVHGPARREKIPVERGHNDDKPLEPHADIDEERQHENHSDAPPDSGEPQKLGHENVAANHGPVGPGEWS